MTAPPVSPRPRALRAEDRSQLLIGQALAPGHPVARMAGCRGVTGPVPRPLSMSACWEHSSSAVSGPSQRIRPHVLGGLHGPYSLGAMPRIPRFLGTHQTPDARALVDAKEAAGSTISVCLPARDEEATVGHIV